MLDAKSIVRHTTEMLGRWKPGTIGTIRVLTAKSQESRRGAIGRSTYDLSGLQEANVADASRSAGRAPT